MTENKRFDIVKSKLIKDGWVISDKLKQFTFPTLKGDKRALFSYCKALNELAEENNQLKYDNFNLNKTVECLDKTVKEQCNKLDWANECGVRGEEEYNKWIGGKDD